MGDLAIKSEFGYVVICFVLSVFINMWHGHKVGGARKLYKVNYPATYLVELEEGTGKITQDNAFNCYQRAHQNFLENYFAYMGLMFLGGLQYPIESAVAGLVYLLGRVVYAIGYMSGDPKKRLWGSFQYIGILALIALAIASAVELLR